jgi:hypothetical protein
LECVGLRPSVPQASIAGLTSLFSFVIGKKSGVYQAQVLIFFADPPQPPPIGASQERRKQEKLR